MDGTRQSAGAVLRSLVERIAIPTTGPPSVESSLVTLSADSAFLISIFESGKLM